jgi:hypothetical protein
MQLQLVWCIAGEAVAPCAFTVLDCLAVLACAVGSNRCYGCCACAQRPAKAVCISAVCFQMQRTMACVHLVFGSSYTVCASSPPLLICLHHLSLLLVVAGAAQVLKKTLFASLALLVGGCSSLAGFVVRRRAGGWFGAVLFAEVVYMW